MSHCQAAVGACCHPSCSCGVDLPASRSFTHAELIELMKGAFKECRRMTPEQQKLHQQLAAEYGDAILQQARELSGLTTCMVALGRDDLTSAEREHMYRQASVHLEMLIGTMMSPAVSAKVTECAKRLDDAIALWAADEVEKRDGLPS